MMMMMMDRKASELRRSGDREQCHSLDWKKA